MSVKSLKQVTVAIVTIRHRCPMPRDVTYQLTLDPADFSDSREHIRVGNYEGDELRGWIRSDDIEIREQLRIKPKKNSRSKVRYQREPQAVAA